MSFRTRLSALVRRATLGAALVGTAGLAAGCTNDVDITNPNQPSSETFWRSAGDAEAGVTATYNALLQLGTFQRWQAFTYDLRSDIGTVISPWSELEQYTRFQFPAGYDFEVNRESWNHPFTLIGRANLAIANVPGIEMNAARRDQLVGEAKFLRGLMYFRLITLFGGNVPLITTPQTTADRPASADSARIWAQIEADFTDAVSTLPVQSMAQSGGRATRGAARGMLGKTLLQQRKWQQAATALAPIVNQQVGSYALVADYGRLFRQEGNNSEESLFEVQMGNEATCGQGLCGLNIAKMSGACGPGFCDGRPTRWYFEQFRQQTTTTGQPDPRLEATIFYYKGDTTRVYGRTWRSWRDSSDQSGRYQDPNTVFWKKYTEYYVPNNNQSWEAQINYKVLRYADVLLMYAEALNEQGTTAQAIGFVNQVRARANMPALSTALSQAAAREAILRERIFELGFEGSRWLDMGRHNLFADLAGLRARDADFLTFAPRAVVLPIPQTERNLNPNINQNNGW